MWWWSRNSAHPNAKLTEDQVRQIYKLAHSGRFSLAEIAAAFDVSKPTVFDIKSGRQWGWLWKEKDDAL